MATINNILGVIPAPVAAVLMLGGFIFYALGCTSGWATAQPSRALCST